MNDQLKDVLREVSDDFIKDSFYYKGEFYVVIDPKIYNGKAKSDDLIICKVVNENGEDVIRALTQVEYYVVAKVYSELLETFDGGNK